MGRKRRRTAFVLDCSVTMAWFYEDEANDYADAVQESLPQAAAVVPSLWPLEVANVLLIGERRRRTTAEKVTEFVATLRSLTLVLDDKATKRAWSDVLVLGRTHKLSAYDAAYLDLALRRGLPLATLDAPLRAAANAVGVTEYRP